MGAGPNLNAFAERFVRSIKQECLRHIIALGERHLRIVVGEFIAHTIPSAITRASAISSHSRRPPRRQSEVASAAAHGWADCSTFANERRREAWVKYRAPSSTPRESRARSTSCRRPLGSPYRRRTRQLDV